MLRMMARSLEVLFFATAMIWIQVSFSKPYDVVVTDVRADSAVIHWKTTERLSSIERFKVHCDGTRHYISVDGHRMFDADEKIQYATAGKSDVFIGDLQANFNYSCTLKEYVGQDEQVLHGEVSEPFQFATDYGDPEEPVAPLIQKQSKNHLIKISLFSTSTRFGPISGYQVQFHLVESKTTEDLPMINDDLLEPFSPFSQLLTKNKARQSSEPKSFWVDFGGGTLPTNITVDETLLNGTLKKGQEYTVITVPYTLHQEQNNSFVLFTPSKPSAIFKTYAMTAAQLNIDEPLDLAIAIALGVLLPLVVLGYLGCFGLLVFCVLRRRKKKTREKDNKGDASMLRRARLLGGGELPWYHQQSVEDTQSDHQLLDPFSSVRRTESSSPSQTGQQQQMSRATGHRQSIKSQNMNWANEHGLLTRRESAINSPTTSGHREPTEVQNHQIHVLSPQMTDSMANQQLPDSVEIWATPNTSPSTSLTIEHIQSSPASEVENNSHTITATVKCTPVLNVVSTVSLTSDGEGVYILADSSLSSCLSGNMSAEEQMQEPAGSTTDVVITLYSDLALNKESPSDYSADLNEHISVTEDPLVGKLSSDEAEVVSVLEEPVLDGVNVSSIDLKEKESDLEELLMVVMPKSENNEQEEDSSVIEEPSADQILGSNIDLDHMEEPHKTDTSEHSDSDIDLRKDYSTVENILGEGNLYHLNSSTNFMETASVTEEPLLGGLGILEHIQSSNKYPSVTKESSKDEILERVDCHRSIELTEEDSVIQDLLAVDQEMLKQRSQTDLKKVVPIMDKPLMDEIPQNFDGISGVRVSEEDSIVKAPLTCGILEPVHGSTYIEEDTLIMEESSKGAQLESIDSSMELRDREDSKESLTCSKLDHVYSSTDLKEDILIVEASSKGAKLERMDSNMDLRDSDEDSISKEPLTCEFLGHVHSSIDLREEVAEEPSAECMLRHTGSSITSSEENFEIRQPLTEGVLKRVDSSLDLREAVSTTDKCLSEEMHVCVHISSSNTATSDEVEKLKDGTILNSNINLRDTEEALVGLGGMLELINRSVQVRGDQGVSIVTESTVDEFTESFEDTSAIEIPLTHESGSDLRQVLIVEEPFTSPEDNDNIDHREDVHVTNKFQTCEELEYASNSTEFREGEEGLVSDAQEIKSDSSVCQENPLATTQSTTVGMLERVGNSIDLRQFVQEPLLDTTLKCISSDSDCREETSVCTEPLTILECVSNSLDLRDVVEEVASGSMSRHTDIDDEEEVTVMEEPIICGVLERVKSNIDLREEPSIPAVPFSDSMLKQVDSSTDLWEEQSVEKSTRESQDLLHIESLFDKKEQHGLHDTSSLELAVSDSCLVDAEANDNSKDDDFHDNAQSEDDVDIHKTVDQLLQTEAGDTEQCKLESAIQTQKSDQPIVATHDDVRIIMELNEEETRSYDDQLSPNDEVTLTVNPSPMPTSQLLSIMHTPTEKTDSNTEQVTPSHLRSLSQVNLKQRCAESHPHSTSSLPLLSQGNQSQQIHSSQQLSILRPVGSDRSQSTASTSARNEIYDAHSIQLSRVSNQSRSTSSGNYSLTSQILRNSISDSGSDLSGHHRPVITKNKSDTLQQSKKTSSLSGSCGSHSLTSQVYKYSDSGSSYVIFSKTVEEQHPMEASLDDKHTTLSQWSVSGSSDNCDNISKEVIQTAAKSFPEITSGMDVLPVQENSDLQSPQSTEEKLKSKLISISQESVHVGLLHSKPALNLTDECLAQDCALQESDSVSFQLEVSETVIVVNLKKNDSSDYLNHGSLGMIPHSQPLTCESPGHIAVTIDLDECLDETVDRPSTLSETNTTSSQSGTSSSSTEYYTALENLEFSSESGKEGGVLSPDSASQHRDSIQPATELIDDNHNYGMLKASSSASLFIPRGLSNIHHEQSSPMRLSRRRGSTLHTILEQASESSDGGEDHRTARVYEPY